MHVAEEAVHDAAVKESNGRGMTLPLISLPFRRPAVLPRLRGSQHPCHEPRSRATCQAAGERTHHSGQRHQWRSQRGLGQDAGGETCGEGNRAACPDQPAGLLQGRSVAHARRANRLAAAAPEATIQVKHEATVGGVQLAAGQRAHEHDAPARAVALVPRHQERGAALEAEPAMNTRVEAGEGLPRHR